MRKRREPERIEDARLVSDQRGAEYCGMGLQTFKKWSEGIGAVRRFGKLRRNDMRVIEAALDEMARENENSPTI